MSEEQRISSLIISIALCKSLTNYGIKFRISVFGETNNVWLLSDKFEDNDNNLKIQLNRLRDALACGQRLQSFPANCLIKLKQNFENQKKTNYKYVQILISSLISPQVVDEEINWDYITGQKIIVFGLKTKFNDNFLKELYESMSEDIKNLLTIKYRKDKKSRSEHVSQVFFEPTNINKNNLKAEEKNFKTLIEEL